MSFRVRGKLHTRFDAQQVTERFRKREFVLEIEDGRYPETVLFQLTGNRCEALDAHEPGTELEVEFDLRGREWKSPKGEIKFFNSLEVWKLEAVGGRKPAAGRDDEPPPPDEPPAWVDDSEDVPF